MSIQYGDAMVFVQNLAPTWRKTQHEMLAQLMMAMLARSTLCPSEIARELPDGPHSRGPQSLHGRLKRVNRFLDNPRLDEAGIFVRCLQLAIRFSSDLPEAADLLPILLDTTYYEPFAALVATVPCGGRGLPILYTTYHRTELQACIPDASTWPQMAVQPCPLRRRRGEAQSKTGAQVRSWGSQNLIEEQLLAYLWSMLPATLNVVVVADRGFARASLMRWFLRHQRQFVIRFDGDTWLRLPDGKAAAVKQLLGLRPGQSCWLPTAAYGKEERVPVAVLALWETGHKEPWFLATNLSLRQTTETAYRWRMRIEAANRDEKSGVILREGADQHKLTSVLHLHRLLLTTFCLHWLAALTGLQAYHDLAQPETIATALETIPPNAQVGSLINQGPASPPPVLPHRGPTPPLPAWMRRFATRGHLSYVRLGLEILRDNAFPSLVTRAVRWLGLYLWLLAPLWHPRQLRYRLRHWWPVPT